jgi:hypothetical protein
MDSFSQYIFTLWSIAISQCNQRMHISGSMKYLLIINLYLFLLLEAKHVKVFECFFYQIVLLKMADKVERCRGC